MVEPIPYKTPIENTQTQNLQKKPPHQNRARQSHVGNLLLSVLDKLYLHTTISYCIDTTQAGRDPPTAIDDTR